MRWFAPAAQAGFSADDRGAQYGDGLFETIAIRAAQPRLLERHLDRLAHGVDKLGLSAPPAYEIEALLGEAIGALGAEADYAVAKLIVVAAPGERGYRRRTATTAQIRVGIAPAKPVPAQLRTSGVAVRICETRIAKQPALAGLKTLNRLEQVLARAEWDAAEIFEGLMLDTDAAVVCGTMSNVFASINHQLVTPALDTGGVAGVMRAHLLELFAAHGQACQIGTLTLTDLERADEVFLTNSQFGVLSVASIGGNLLSGREQARQASEWLRQAGVREEPA